MVALLFLEVSMLVWCEVVLDAYTREVVSFRFSDPSTLSGAKSMLQEIAIGSSAKGRHLEVDKSRLDFMIGPDPA